MADFPHLPPFNQRQAKGDPLPAVQEIMDALESVYNLTSYGPLSMKFRDLLSEEDLRVLTDATKGVSGVALTAQSDLHDLAKKLKKQGNVIDWGFDTTWFPSVEAWENVLSAVGIRLKRPKKKSGSYGWIWPGRGIEIVTAYDPFTGKRYDGGKNSVGLAGYIGITGEKSLVRKAVSAIKANAEGIKDESRNERDYI
jgi:hypothetical protein